MVVQHILGVTVTHQDMEAIDPDYYKNLLQITTLPLEDLGLDLTFSADTEMFGACRPSRSFVPFPPPGVEVSLAIPSPGGHVPVEQLSSLYRRLAPQRQPRARCAAAHSSIYSWESNFLGRPSPS